MKKILTLAAAVLFTVSMIADTAVLSMNMGVDGAVATGANSITGASGCDAEGFTVAITGNTGKSWSAGNGSITFNEKTYSTLKNSNGAQNTITLPENTVATAVTFYAATNDNSIAGILSEFNGASCNDEVSSLKDYENPTIIAKEFATPVGTFSFTFSTKQVCFIAVVTYQPSCQDPEFTVPEGGVGFVGDPISLAVSSLNKNKPINSAVTVDGVIGVSGTDFSYSVSVGQIQAIPLKAGRFVITFTQASNGEYCAADDSAIYVISEKAGVAAVTIEGPTAGYKGNEVTYTATAESATEYRWKVNGAIQAGADSAKFIYTPAAIGAYNIVCEARNEYNDQDAWIASDPIALTVSSLYGELIKAVLQGGASADMSGVLGGTFDSNLSSGKYKIDKAKYAGVKLASGSFQEGDTVIITMTAAGANYPCLFADKDRTELLFLATSTSTALEYKIVLPAAANGKTSVYVSRDANDETYKWNPTLSSISVVRPVPVKSTVETLTAVTIDDVAISAENLANLQNTGEVILTDSYLNAPVVKFTKHVVVTYEDESTKESDDVIEKTSSQSTASLWGASATIGGNTYAVYTVKQFSYVVTYKLGEQTLGSENVSANGSPAEYAQYQTMTLASFDGWYSDADLAEGHKVANIAAEVITEDKTFYAKFTYLYAESVNIEQLVLDNGVGYDLMALMGTKHYASNWTNDLDSLNDEKTARNYAFLGQKVKAAGKLLDLRLPANGVLRVKFGNVGATPQVSINKGEYADMQIEEGVYTYEASASAYISIKTVSNSTVVFKQIMINEAIADVTLPSSGTATTIENAAVEAKAVKTMINGQLFILRDGKTYDVHGVEVR